MVLLRNIPIRYALKEKRRTEVRLFPFEREYRLSYCYNFSIVLQVATARGLYDFALNAVVIIIQCKSGCLLICRICILVVLRFFFALCFEFRLALFDKFRPIDVLVRATMSVALPCVRTPCAIASE